MYPFFLSFIGYFKNLRLALEKCEIQAYIRKALKITCHPTIPCSYTFGFWHVFPL